MKLSAITVLSCNLIWGFVDAQYTWTKNNFNQSMCGKAACEDLVVETVQGKVQGRAFESVLNQAEYYGFLGIPYAKPPVGDLRFQAPEPASSWSGTYPAHYERHICEQIIMVTELLHISSEDCLYLNVYTPEVPGKIDKPKPVMVSIHGGGFMLFTGSRLFFSPDYLITRDVVIVTINYRLGVLGFLNLGVPECPGNMGLKDQTLALKWVQQNIARFGGDPNNVAIIGESAGGSSVSYHTISPLSKGLFHKAIMQSGTALSPWALIYNPILQAFEIGKRCGYSGKDPSELVKFFKTKSSMFISVAAVSWILHNRRKYPARYILLGPSVEKIKEGAFLPDYPLNLMKSAVPVPTICGVNNKEGIAVIVGYDNQFIEKVSKNFSLFLTDNFPMDPKLVPEASSKIKQLYFEDKQVGMETANVLVDLYSDITNYYTYDSLEFVAKSSTPPFVYYFAYEGDLNLGTKSLNLFTGVGMKGAVHADDQFYIYYPYIISSLISINNRTRKMIDIMTTMLTNFVKTGNPSGDLIWNASSFDEPGYFLIDKNPRMVPGKFHDQRFESMRSILDPAMKPGVRLYDIF
ncbi:esterase E4-like [Planococcus citri]|uniref:esterase E4-like n=1 Tax=Planococcus citri TaxID=170843 RepID=UPI0031F90B50